VQAQAVDVESKGPPVDGLDRQPLGQSGRLGSDANVIDQDGSRECARHQLTGGRVCPVDEPLADEYDVTGGGLRFKHRPRRADECKAMRSRSSVCIDDGQHDGSSDDRIGHRVVVERTMSLDMPHGHSVRLARAGHQQDLVDEVGAKITLIDAPAHRCPTEAFPVAIGRMSADGAPVERRHAHRLVEHHATAGMRTGRDIRRCHDGEQRRVIAALLADVRIQIDPPDHVVESRFERRYGSRMDANSQSVMTVEVWADVVCPWCRLGKAYLDEAIQGFEHRDDVTVVWRSFELDPSAPASRPESLNEHLAQKLGRSPDQIDELQEMIRQRGADVGVDFRFDDAKTGNTFDAHRLLHLAKDQGLQAELSDALYQAYFTDGVAIGDPDSLVEVATSVGLAADEVRGVLDSSRYAEAVRADEAEARALQVTGVPFFVFDRRVAAGGAQPPDVLLAGLEQAWAARGE
jgi:predicted DsbA family dithiol-disulfide isomerase